MRWTKDDLTMYLAQRQKQVAVKDDPDQGPEKVIQVKCQKYCKTNGWPCFHDYSKKSNTPGWPDMMIFMDNGRVELIELKAAGGELRTEQQALHRQLMFLGHKVHVVKSYKRFIQIMKGGDEYVCA